MASGLMDPVDPNLRANVLAVHGDAGARWLQDIPRLLAEIERSWDIQVSAPYDLSYNYVAPATSGDGAECVVKLTVPGTSGLTREAAALSGYGGRGAVRLLSRDDGRGALLLERAEPGRELAALGPYRDDEATTILCTVMRQLWHEPACDRDLPRVITYGSAFGEYARQYGHTGPLPLWMVHRAGELLDQLSASAARQVLLHGDLHHHNVLQAQRQPWLAIDPHGVIGDPGFDVGAMLYNPVTMNADQLRQLLPSRLDHLADLTDLGIDRVLGWGFVMAVLSEVWSTEDHGEIDGRPLSVAEILATRMP